MPIRWDFDAIDDDDTFFIHFGAEAEDWYDEVKLKRKLKA